MFSEKWDRHFLGMALHHARMSKDPNRKWGAVVVGPDREVLSAGFNGFPRGIADTPDRLDDPDMKLKLIVHAEMNSLLAAARIGMRLKGCVMYIASADEYGMVSGGPPCSRCTVEIIQVGISEIVSYPRRPRSEPSKWHEEHDLSHNLLIEAGITYREVSVEPRKLPKPKQVPRCPRRDESPSFYFPGPDYYRAEDNTCDYCGSLDPEIFMQRVEAGDVELGTTHKDYKVYVHNAGGESFKQYYRACPPKSTCTGPDDCTHWCTQETGQVKFYFQHLTVEQRMRFVELLNEKALRFYGGYSFGVLPFFCTQREASS